jgi:hypothetical protein
MPEEEEEKEEEKEEEDGGGGYSASYSFLWYDTEKPNRGGILEYNTLVDISSSTSVPNICYPLNLLCMPREKGNLYVCEELPFIQRCSVESGLWRTNSKAIGLFTPRSVHPLPGARLALARELQSDRLTRLQTVHFAFFCFITDVNA